MNPTSYAERFAPRPVRMDPQAAELGRQRLPSAVQLMGFNSLRPAQECVVSSLMMGRDVLAIMPTSAGKTACFVVPTMAMGWKALVFSPLQALMRDQVTGLQRRWADKAQMLRSFGYVDPPVDYMSGQRNDAENRQAAMRWASGELALFYVAPERMGNEDFQMALRATRPDAIFIDEAHCLSQWGHNFRSAYIKTGDFIREYDPKIVGAFTATATPPVQQEIRDVLGMQQAIRELHWVRRDNLILRSATLEDDMDLIEPLRRIQGSILIYGSSKPKLAELQGRIRKALPDEEEVGLFHADLRDSDKAYNQERFMLGRIRIMLATCAFGMGIDKPDIRGVIHFHYPGSLEALVQETGRAGRDGEQSECLTFFSKDADRIQRSMIESGYPSSRNIRDFYQYLLRKQSATGTVELRLEDMAQDASVSSRHISSMMEILKGSLVVERAQSEDRTLQVAFTGDSADSRFEAFRVAVAVLGFPVPESKLGHVAVDQDALYARLDKAPGTVNGWMREWSKQGLLHTIAPYRGSTTRVIGDLSLVNFDNVDERAELARKGLAHVQQYQHIPDGDKHEFIERCFYQDYGDDQ